MFLIKDKKSSIKKDIESFIKELEEFILKISEEEDFYIEKDYLNQLKDLFKLLKRKKDDKEVVFNLAKCLFSFSSNIKIKERENKVRASLSNFSYLIFLLDKSFALVLDLITAFNLKVEDFKKEYFDFKLRLLETQSLKNKLFDYLDIFSEIFNESYYYDKNNLNDLCLERFEYYSSLKKAFSVDFKTEPEDLFFNIQLIAGKEFSYKIYKKEEDFWISYQVEFFILGESIKVFFSYSYRGVDDLISCLIYLLNCAYQKANLDPPFYILNAVLGDSYEIFYLRDKKEAQSLLKEKIVYQPSDYEKENFKFNFITPSFLN